MNKIRDGKRNEAMTICSKKSVLAVVQEEVNPTPFSGGFVLLSGFF